MKIITSNLLNRFWKNGIKPIKDSLAEAEGIIVVARGHTIASIISGVPEGKVRTYRLQDIPTDYPPAMISGGNTSNPVLIVQKASTILSYMSIQAPNMSSGTPHIIYGYFNSGKVFWGTVQ